MKLVLMSFVLGLIALTAARLDATGARAADQDFWWVHSSIVTSSPLDEFDVESHLTLSGPVLRVLDGAMVRTVNLVLNVVVGPVRLGTYTLGRCVDVGGSEPVVVTLTGFAAGEAQALAQAALCDEIRSPPSDDLAQPHEFSVAPAPGLNWGQVQSADDLEIGLETLGPG